MGYHRPKSNEIGWVLPLLVLVAAMITGATTAWSPVGPLVLGGSVLFWGSMLLSPTAIPVALAASSAFPFYAVIGGHVVTLIQLVAILGFLRLIVRSFAIERMIPPRASQLVPAFLFLLAIAFSGIRALYFHSFFAALLKYAGMFIVYVVVLLLLNTGVTRGQFVFIFVTLSIVAAIVHLTAFMWSVLVLGIDPSVQLDLLRRTVIATPFGNANALAAFLAMCLPSSLVLSLSSGRWRYRGLARCAPAVLLLALLATASRGGLLAAGAGCVAMLASSSPSIPASSRWRAGVLLLGVAGVFWMMWLALGFGQLFRITGLSEYNVACRLLQWLLGLRVFEAHPIVGIGLGNISQVHFRNWLTAQDVARIPIDIELPRVHHLHSTPITLAAETGIIGLGSFALVIGVGLRNALRASRFEQVPDSQIASGVAGAIVAFLVGSLFEYYLTGALGMPLFIFLALAVSIPATRSSDAFSEVPKCE